MDDVITAIIGYFIAANITFLTARHPSAYPTMWVADSVILTLLLINQKQRWPVILLAGFLGHSLSVALILKWSPTLAVSGAIGMMQTGFAAWLIRYTEQTNTIFAKVPSHLSFILAAGVLAPAAGGMISAIFNALTSDEALLYAFSRWFFGNSLGFLIFTPFLLGVFDGSFRRAFVQQSTPRKIEVLALYLAHIAITTASFAQNVMPLLFVPVSAVMLLSFRLGRQGSIVGVMIVTIIGAIMTFSNRGPVMFTNASPEIQEYFFQVYLVILLGTTLPVATAITLKSKVLDSLAEREAALRLLMSHRSDVILGFDATGHCHWAEGPVQDYLGITPEAMIGRSIDTVDLQTNTVAKEIIACKEAGNIRPAAFEFTPMLRPELILEASLSIRWNRGAPIGAIVTLRDTTRHRAREANDLVRTETDHLTGLLTRPSFRAHVSIVMRDTSQQNILVFIDLDRFPAIQSTHGYAIANAALIEAAKRIHAATRSDDIIARLGDNEFAVLLRCDLITAQIVCQRIVDTIRETPLYHDETTSVLGSVSCGIAEHRPGMSREDLIDSAEMALYDVRQRGGNGVRTAP